MAKNTKTIEFEDHGQDFQDWVWCGFIVTNHETIRPGDTVHVLNKDRVPSTMNYPCVDVRVSGTFQEGAS